MLKAPPIAPPKPPTCPVCGTPQCWALMRCDVPPTGLLDFLDRLISRISSGHWTLRHTAHIILLTTAVTFPVCTVAVLAAGDLSSITQWGTRTPWGWGSLAGGGALLGGSGYAVRRIRRHRRERSLRSR